MSQNIRPMIPIDLKTFDLQAQFKRCETWQDPDQWDTLALLYYQRGYYLNALHCFGRADACRQPVLVDGVDVGNVKDQTVMAVVTDLGMPGQSIELTLVPVAVETEVE